MGMDIDKDAICMRFQVLMMVSMEMTVLWGVAP
jgi:hypothetical protein